MVDLCYFSNCHQFSGYISCWMVLILYILTINMSNADDSLIYKELFNKPCYEEKKCMSEPCLKFYNSIKPKSFPLNHTTSYHKPTSYRKVGNISLPLLSPLSHDSLGICRFSRKTMRCQMNSHPLLRSQNDTIHMLANESSYLSWNDVVIYVLMGSSLREETQSYWLQILYDSITPLKMKNETLNYVLLGNSCNEVFDPMSMSNYTNCNFPNIELMKRKFPMLNITIIRTSVLNEGKDHLPCKVAIGMHEIYKIFPDKKFYFAMDDDTVVSPRKLYQLFRETYFSYRSDSVPLYLGTSFETCHGHRQVDMATNSTIFPNQTTKNIITNTNYTNICFGQGGAGYLLNNLAMRVFGDIPEILQRCENGSDLDMGGGDQLVGLYLYKKLRLRIINCPALTSGSHNAVSMSAIISHHRPDRRFFNTMSMFN